MVSPLAWPRRGFTLVEMLVVLAIILVTAGLLLAAVQQVRTTSLHAQCSNNLRQLGIACHHVNQTCRRMPSAWNWFPAVNASDGSAGIGPLFFHLLPYLEEKKPVPKQPPCAEVSAPGLF
jgi:prepilin-type N-terminal cleavage/methylation domain-containing protein